MKETSSSEILRNIFKTNSGVNFTIIFSGSSALFPSEESQTAIKDDKPSLVIFGCLQPQPSSVSSPHLDTPLAN